MDNRGSTVLDYSMRVHRSLMKRDLIAGVSRLSLALIISVTYIGVVEFRLIWFLAVGPVLFFIIKAMTKKDEYLVEIVLSSLLTPDNLYP